MGDIKEDDSLADRNGKSSPPTEEKAKIGAKIHQFENGEREKVEREEKERKRALFERKLSKFDKDEGSSRQSQQQHPPVVKKLSHVDKMAKKFSYERKSEEEERELRRRREEFERKRSGFMSEDGESRKTSEEDTEESRNRLSKMRLMFEDRDAALAAAEAEADRKRREEEEAEQRRKDFEAKSSIFKMSADSHDR